MVTYPNGTTCCCLLLPRSPQHRFYLRNSQLFVPRKEETLHGHPSKASDGTATGGRVLLTQPPLVSPLVHDGALHRTLQRQTSIHSF